MKKRRLIKLLSWMIVAFMCFGIGLSTFVKKAKANDTLENGTYEIAAFLRSASSDQASMGNAAIVKPVQLIVQDGKLTLRMECKPLTTSLGSKQFTGYLAAMNYFPGWTGGTSGIESPKSQTPQPVSVESYYEDVYDTYNDPKKGTDSQIKGKLYPHYMQLPVDYKEEEIWVQVYVPVMENIVKGNGLQYARLQLSWDTLKKVSDDIPNMPVTGTGNQQTTSTAGEEKTTEKTTSTAAKKTSTQLNIKQLADGIYSITGKMLKADKTTESMANKAVNHTICLTVKKGNYYLTLDFQGLNINSRLGYLSRMKYFQTGYKLDRYGIPAGKLKNVTVDSYQMDGKGGRIKDSFGTNYPDKVTFPLIKEALNDGYVPLQVFVPIMDSISPGSGTQAVFLKLDLNSVKSVASKKVFEEQQSSGTTRSSETSGGAVFQQSSEFSTSDGAADSTETSGQNTKTAEDTASESLENQSFTENGGTEVEEEEENSPIVIPSALSIFVSMAGLFYKVKSRGL